MSEKIKKDFSLVEVAREGAANLALSTMAVAATVGLFPHLGARQAVTVNGQNTSVQDESNFMRREKDDYRQQYVNETDQHVPGRTKDL